MIKGCAGVISKGQRRREAAEWFVEHESADEGPPARLPAWDQWWRDARNRSEYDAVVRLRQQTRWLPPPSVPTDDELLHDSVEIPALQEGRAARSFKRLCESLSSLVERPRFAAFATCAAILAFTITALVFFRTYSPTSDIQPQRYATGPGEQGDITLTDGSQVTLGGDTHLLVRVTWDTRNIVLERGEARFKVHHDARRPFVVEAGGGSVTAVGTEFVVRRYSRYSKLVRVWVTEGAVQVAPVHDIAMDTLADTSAQLQPAPWTPVRLVRGQEITYDAQRDAGAPHSSNAEVAADLMQGAFVYRGRPLAEVIEDVQRYTARRISIDPGVAELKYSGFVLQRNVDQWIRGLPEVFPGIIVENNADNIVIRSRLAPRTNEPQSALR